MHSLRCLLTLTFFCPLLALGSTAKSCIPPGQALQHIGKDACVAAHVYRVVDAGSGVHFLDVCSPDTADSDCHFFILSQSQDAKSTAYLQGLAGQDIHIRGKVRDMQGRAAIMLSNPAQLHGGKEKFHPNPELEKNFSAENATRAFSTTNGETGQHGVHFSHRGK